MATITVRSLTGGNSNHPEPVFTSNALATDLVSAGVIGAITLNTGSGGTGAFAVNAQSSPNMSVRVNGPAVAYVTATPTGSVSQLLRVDMNTFQDVTISANASGSTKYDWIYIKIDPDLALNPDTSATTVGTIVTSRSSSNSSDNGTPPTYGYNLGYVTVANGASSITNSNITDSRVQTGLNALTPSSVTYTNLLSTIFSGQVKTQANAGNAGGNMWWINLGGIKLLWGVGAAVAQLNGATVMNFTLPTFFTTVTTVLTSSLVGGSTNQYITINSASTTTISLYGISTGAFTITPEILVIGT